jgi:GTP-binding protein
MVMPGNRTVAIVGRPNVGKSALFNRLAGRRIAIVHDQPGVTRDRITAMCKLGSAPFELIDTGGIGTEVDADFSEQVRTEAEIAITTASVIVFVVDAQHGLTPVDREVGDALRRSGKPVVLAVNKIDHPKHENLEGEFYELGFDRVLPISAEHNRGIIDLVSAIEERLPEAGDAQPAKERPIAIAIVGRPNVGKSSLINAILKDHRTLVSAISGTTRDSVDIPYRRKDRDYILIDTAGIRGRGKQESSIEIFSVMRSEQSIRRANLCVLVIDAAQGLTSDDKKIAGLIQEAEKPCVVVLNKWDLVQARDPDADVETLLADFRAELFFLPWAPLLLASARTGEQLSRLFRAIDRVRDESQERIGTGPLNRKIEAATASHPPPSKGGRRLKILYLTQVEPERDTPIPNPTFALFVNDPALLNDTYRRYLDAQLRAISPFTGLPIRLLLRGRPERGAGPRRKGKKRQSNVVS